jgi:hypothetical protein
MIDYSTIANTVGAFPNVVGQNASGGAATDGTPYLKSVIDDLWGANQALMDAAGLSPNAASEATGASQRLDAMRRVCGAPGEIALWVGAATPAASGNRIIPLEGQGVEIVNYPELVAATYVGDAANGLTAAVHGFYKATTAAGTTRDTAGSWFILPDYRGHFIRGRDAGAILDPDGAWRTYYGFAQEPNAGQHEHALEVFDNFGSMAWDRTIQAKIMYVHQSDPGGSAIQVPVCFAHGPATNDETRAAADLTNAVETRPHNQVAQICVRY